MADNFGLKIGVEGEKEFKNALRNINAQFKVLGSEMKLVDSQFSKQDKSVESLTAHNEVLTKKISAQEEKVQMLRKALENAADSFGTNDKRTQAWQVKLNNAQAELNHLNRELDDSQKALNHTADEFNDAETQADQFGDEINRAADTADHAGGRFENLGSVLKGMGVALAAGVAAIGAAAVSAGKVMVDMTVASAAYADEMITESAVTGMSVEHLQAYSYAADLVDVSLDTLTDSMAKNVKSMSNAAEGSAQYADAYARLGVAATNTDGTLRNSEDVYWDVIDALGGVENETERDAIAMQLFGKSAQDLNPLIAQGRSGIAALTDEAHQMGAVLSEESIAKLGAFDDSVQRLKQGSEAAKRVIGTVLLPQLQTLSDDGVELLGDFTSGLVDAGGDFNKISEVLGDTAGKAVDMLMKSLPQFIQVGMDIVGAIGGALVHNLPTLIDSTSQIVMTLLQGLIGALPQITEGAVQLMLALVNGLLDNLPSIVEAALQMIATLASGIGEALPELVPAIVQTIITICNVLLQNMDQVLAAAFAIIQGLAEGLLTALPTLVAALPEIITSVITFITSNLPQIVQMGIQLLGALIMGLLQGIPQLVASIPQIISALVGGLGQAVSSVANVGKNIVKGLWNGIQSMATWITSKVKNFFSGIVDSVKGILGIHSPSTVFAGIGENMGTGIGVGFTDSMSDVERNMKKALNGASGDLQSLATDVVLHETVQTSSSPIAVHIPLYLDGKQITSATSTIQSFRNSGRLRALGVT